MPDLTDLRLAVAGFLQRATTTFSRTEGADTFDVLNRAINNAQLYAERLIDFEQSRDQAKVVITSLAEGVLLTTATEYSSATAMSVKKIITPFIINSTSSPTTYIPVELWSKKRWNDRMRRKLEGQDPRSTSHPSDLLNHEIILVQHGLRLFLSPASTAVLGDSVTVGMDVIKWLPALSDGEDTNFLLDYAFDWMMYRSVFELNFFLKEDERVEISSVLMNDAWNALVKWNEQLVNADSDDTTLN